MSEEIKRNLPRLPRVYYQGHAYVFWTHTLEHRATGWLDDPFHLKFREMALHAQVREHLACPLYVLMPDHMHILWIGAANKSDQWLATRLLRREINRLLVPCKLQHQPHDHVLRESERDTDAFIKTWHYIACNPTRAELTDDWKSYPYLGCLVPGYPDLNPRDKGFFAFFWRVFEKFRQV